MVIPREMEATLGVLADSHDRFDLMRAITRCDELAAEIRRIQLIHTENLCRLANRMAAAAEAYCNHDPAAVVGGLCECGTRVSK